MTVTTIYVPLRTQGTGTATDFDFSFKTIQNVETGETAIIVILLDDLTSVEDVQLEGVDYTVALNSNGSGTVTFNIAPLLTDFVSILLDIPKTQNTNYINLGTDKFPADSHEGTVDKLTLGAQQADEESIRSVKLPDSSTLTNISIPVSVANADNLIAVNSAGDDLVSVKAGDVNLITTSNFGAALILNETAAETRRTLDTWDNLGNSAGTDTYTATPANPVVAYTADQRFTLTFVNAGTGAATLDISGVAADALEKPDGAGGLTALESGDIPAGLKGDIIRNEANTKFILLNPAIQNKVKANTLTIPINAVLTIASGVITPTDSSHTVGTEGATSTDDLDTVTITNIPAGTIGILALTNAAQNIVIKHGTGNIFTKGGEDITLDVLNDRFVYISDGTNVVEVSRTLLTPQNLVETKAISNQATVDFPDVFEAGFNYEIALTNILPVSDSILRCRFEVSSTFQTVTYVGGGVQGSNADGPTGKTSGTTAIDVSGTGAFSIDSATTKGLDGVIKIKNPASTAKHKSIDINVNHCNPSGNFTYHFGNGAYEGSTSAVTGIQFLASTGNLLTGTITINKTPI